MVTTLILILILSVLVIAHELGHFMVAKKIGARVEEFGVGLPPKIWSKKVGETLYSINALPFGGFVKISGDDFEDEATKDKRNFMNKTSLEKALVLVAGVVMNVFLAILIYYVIFVSSGFKTMTMPLFFDYSFPFGEQETISTVVVDFAETSSGSKAGIDAGEAIIEVDGVPVYTAEDIRTQLIGKDGQQVQLLLLDVKGTSRDIRSLRATPEANEQGQVLLGVVMSKGFRLTYPNKLLAGISHTSNMFLYSIRTLALIANEAIKARDVAPVAHTVSGPIGIWSAVEGVLEYKGKDAVIGMLDLTALLSLSLAIMNILPIPALDGGRLIFVLVEKIRGKKFSTKVEGSVHKWGFIALLILLLLVTVKDIGKLL